MSGKSSSDVNHDGPATKRLKANTEDDFPYDAHITILQSCGTAISSVHAGQFAKISKNNTGKHCKYAYSGGATTSDERKCNHGRRLFHG
ncbi:hypothetical protein QM012_006990 [Aureobasidium pullulans]|uniref:Uncharacterized protein n=1 Tax=Aureobasidium pullulans TaxID=5580 RepID=A0ABR0TRL3_AURPU